MASTDNLQRHWPKFGSTGMPVDPNHLDVELRLIYNGIYDLQDAFRLLVSTKESVPGEASLWATVSAAGVIIAVDILKSGKYVNVPTITVVGGAPSTIASLKAVLGPDGEIASVTIVSGGTGYKSHPALVVTSND